ncbi:MAG: DegT/DnrJ/EryC1/StrS family aminotransferase [Vulcanimicrobiota bacterium]
MIPRLRPPFGLLELALAAVPRPGYDEARFEQAFANKFGFEHGLFFPYGRSALYALLKVRGQDRQVVMPAYTCSVVAHAVALSGNKPVFVDCGQEHFNMPPAALEPALDEQTSMVILTPIFGYPIERRDCEAVIKKKSPDAFVLYDLAYAFGVHDKRGPQAQEADAALFGLGIGKQLSTLFGGILLLRDPELYQAVKEFRDQTFKKPGRLAGLNKFSYGKAVYFAFREPFLSLVDLLERKTPLLNRFTRHYYGVDGIAMPADFQVRPTALQARLGLSQLERYDQIETQRWAIGQRYELKLAQAGFKVFEGQESQTYSHFPLAVAERDRVIAAMLDKGVGLGKLIDYSCPCLPGYDYSPDAHPHSYWFSQHLVNLPCWPGMTVAQVDQVIEALGACRDQSPKDFL